MFNVQSLIETEQKIFSEITGVDKIVGDTKTIDLNVFFENITKMEEEKRNQELIYEQEQNNQRLRAKRNINEENEENDYDSREEEIQKNAQLQQEQYQEEEKKEIVQEKIIPQYEEKVEVQEPKIIEKKYKIEPNGWIVKVSDNYSTDDELERDVIKILNDKKIAWKVAKKGKDKPITISIRRVDGPGGLMVKNEVVFPYSLDFVVNSFTNLEIEKKWHKGADLAKILEYEKFDEYEREVRYVLTKFPWPMSDREWLTEKKIFKNYCGDPSQTFIITKSCQHQKFPVKDDPVRAIIVIQGHHFQDLGKGSTKLTMISQADVQISGMQSMAEKKMPEGQYKYFEEWLKGLKKIKG